MRVLLLHPDFDVVMGLRAAFSGALLRVEAASSLGEARETLASLSSGVDVALIWVEVFERIGELRDFLASVGPVTAVLIVPPPSRDVEDLAHSAAVRALPLRDVWVMADTSADALIARLDELKLPDKESGGQTANPPPQQSVSYVPPAASSPMPATKGRPGQGSSPAPRKAQTLRAPSGGVNPKGIGRLGVWSAAGGCGATTIACALARLSERTLVGVSEPGLSFALGITPIAPWTALRSSLFREVYLGPSLYPTGAGPTGAGEAELEIPPHVAALSPSIFDLPSGPLSLPLLGSLDCLLYVLTPERANVALAVHALSSLRQLDVRIVWNRASADVTEAGSALSLLPYTPQIVGKLDEEHGALEARSRKQTIPDAASDGVLLGNLPLQLRALAASLYPDVSAPDRSDGRRIKLEFVK